MSENLTDICFVTNDVIHLRTFYETVFGGKVEDDEWVAFVIHIEIQNNSGETEQRT